jgi:hypothetical protein
MKRRKLMHKHIRLIQAFALGISVLSIPTLAVATTATVVDPGVLVAKGAGVRIAVEVTCDFEEGVSVFVGANLTQRVGNSVTIGFGSTGTRVPITCDNTPLIVEVIVTVDAFQPGGGRAFKNGPAIVRVFADVCNADFSQCEFTETIDDIRLVQH